MEAARPDGPRARSRWARAAVDPVRVLDTRQPGQGPSRIVPGAVSVLDLRSIAPAGATAVAVNLTADRTATDGWIRAYPCSGAEPATSNLNPLAGSAVTNAAIVPLGDGRICLTGSTVTDVLVDLDGWLTTGSDVGFAPVAPRRLLDTRTGVGGSLRLAAGSTIELPIGASPGTTAVSLAVTAVAPGGSGFVTVWPCGTTRPVVSSLNPQVGVTRPNLVNVRVGAAGTVCLYSSVATDLLVDVTGEYRSGAPARSAAVAPQRLVDTRLGAAPVTQSNVSYLVAMGSVTAAQLNLTATAPRGDGYLTAYPCLGESWPGTSNVNFGPGETSASAAVLTGSHGYGCVMPSVPTQLVVDLFGYWDDPASIG